MYKNRSILACIPARGGSKGVPGKNLRPLRGKPLIAWTIGRALESRWLDEVIVNTDSPDIAEVGRYCGATIPFLRPTALAADDSPIIDAIRHTVAFYKDAGRSFDYFAILDPTSPVRDPDDIDRMIERLIDGEDRFDAIVSMGKVDGLHPGIMKRLRGDFYERFCADLPVNSNRQDEEPAYYPYGIGYIAKTELLVEHGSFHLDRSAHYIIQRHQNYEIDDPYDFMTMEALWPHVWKEKTA